MDRFSRTVCTGIQLTNFSVCETYGTSSWPFWIIIRKMIISPFADIYLIISKGLLIRSTTASLVQRTKMVFCVTQVLHIRNNSRPGQFFGCSSTGFAEVLKSWRFAVSLLMLRWLDGFALVVRTIQEQDRLIMWKLYSRVLLDRHWDCREILKRLILK